MDTYRTFYRQDLIPQWDKELSLLLNIQQIIERLVKAEKTYVKALNDIQKLRLKDELFNDNQSLLSLQVTLSNFITSLSTQHTEIIENITQDILPDLLDNQMIQKTYRNHYTGIVEEKAKEEANLVANYSKTLFRYNQTIAEYLDDENESTIAKEEVTQLYGHCMNEYHLIKQHNTANQTNFLTICDNFSKRIRYNNVSIAASCARKLFVYFSSSVANTQYDIQAISLHLGHIPTTDEYRVLREEIVIPSIDTSVVACISQPTAVKSILPESPCDISSNNINRCENIINSVQLHELVKSEDFPSLPTTPKIDHVPHSAESIKSTYSSQESLLPLAFILLPSMASLKHEGYIEDHTAIRYVSSLFITRSPNEIESVKNRIQAYLSGNKLAPFHILHLMLSVMLFTNADLMMHESVGACNNILSAIQEIIKESNEAMIVITSLRKCIAIE